ncbi:type II toxin-antitoxin system YafQ family toxin [Helicobacter brantae]|uniref:Type II toxin-antitoxin system mRNA interferase toxin, RelE/StbE family n=1 Tax=Helicobacter brantae TaxID=375927 RepID=A0A3D8J3T1_9HELI|nr:type II toxin-antitoxin system YafQ family toxin [Helicobacter brantae]RDU72177.1 type II toxin-antitoxin system mRNA interferase toxin, RelE/StbE family [Helicobacter brantae]
MLKILRTKIFINDFQKTRFKNHEFENLILFLSILQSNNQLPTHAKNHPLQGEYNQYREFHIGSDLLVIYKIEDSVLYLVRIGTHSQLFR